jgi:hypothetical protein
MWLDIFLLTLGSASIAIGILYRIGQFRAYYWMQPFSYYRMAPYGMVPVGVALLMLIITPIINGTFLEVPFYSLLVFFVLLSVFIYIFQPGFAKPSWINWLEDNYSDIIPKLRHALWRMGPERKEIIENQEKLEAWIEAYRNQQELG